MSPNLMLGLGWQLGDQIQVVLEQPLGRSQEEQPTKEEARQKKLTIFTHHKIGVGSYLAATVTSYIYLAYMYTIEAQPGLVGTPLPTKRDS